MKLTNFEIQREWEFRIQERIAILCGADGPTEEQAKMAREEANYWRMEYHKQRAIEDDYVGHL